MIIVNENEKDDKVDANKDGKADVVELDGGELLRRKVKLVLTKMNPEKVNDALASIYKGTFVLGDGAIVSLDFAYIIIPFYPILTPPPTSFNAPVWISVLAVLTIQFARTVALALTLSDFSKKFADRTLLPIVERATPKEYRVSGRLTLAEMRLFVAFFEPSCFCFFVPISHSTFALPSKRWCPVLLDWLCKSIGISIAWKIQTVLSAFASAMAGGLIMSRAMLHVFFKGRKDHEETNVDEVASYAFAAIGFYIQYSMSFAVPFPLNVFLLPVELADYCLRWAVTKQ